MPRILYVFDLENVALSNIKDKIENMGDAYDYLLFFGFKQKIKNLPLVSTVECLQSDGTGPNYLDFQLTSELGLRTNSNTYSEIIIISDDTGFKAVANHLTRYTNTKVSRQGSDAFLRIKTTEVFTEQEPTIVIEETCSENFSKAYVQSKLKFLISSKSAPSMNRKLYNFVLHTPSTASGCLKTPKQWKELIRKEFAPMSPEKVYNALKKGGLIEKHNEKRKRLNLAKAADTVAVLKTLK